MKFRHTQLEQTSMWVTAKDELRSQFSSACGRIKYRSQLIAQMPAKSALKVCFTSVTETHFLFCVMGRCSVSNTWTDILSNSHLHRIVLSECQWDESTTLVITQSTRESWRLPTAALFYGGIFRLRCKNTARLCEVKCEIKSEELQPLKMGLLVF